MSDTQTPNKDRKSISIKIPRVTLPSVQMIILILLIIVGALQTAQLYALDTTVVSAESSAPAPTSSSATGSSGGSVTSSLPDMVGGC